MPLNWLKHFVPSYFIRHCLPVRRPPLVQSVASVLQRMLCFSLSYVLWMRQYSWKGGYDQSSHITSCDLHWNDLLPTSLPGKLSIYLSSLNSWTTCFPGFSSLILPNRIGCCLYMCWTWVQLFTGGSILSMSVFLPAYLFLKIQFIYNIVLVLGVQHDHLFTRISLVSLAPGTQ